MSVCYMLVMSQNYWTYTYKLCAFHHQTSQGLFVFWDKLSYPRLQGLRTANRNSNWPENMLRENLTVERPHVSMRLYGVYCMQDRWQCAVFCDDISQHCDIILPARLLKLLELHWMWDIVNYWSICAISVEKTERKSMQFLPSGGLCTLVLYLSLCGSSQGISLSEALKWDGSG